MKGEKKIFKVIDEQGRIAIPQDIRVQAGIEVGDIVHLSSLNGEIILRKVVIVESQTEKLKETEEYIIAAMKKLNPRSIVRITREFIELIEGKEE